MGSLGMGEGRATAVSRRVLFGKLNRTLFRSIESATTFARLRGNPHVELTHWLHQLWQLGDSDLHRICRHCGIEEREGAHDGSGPAPVMPGEATGAMAAAADGESALARYCSDLTERARGGGIDGVVGRAHEIRTMVDILLRRRPLLTGDAGDQHGEPYHFFRELVTDVQAMLNDVLVRSAGSIALTERPNGMRVASVEPSEPQGFASLVFAVAAQMPPDQLATQFPAHCKAAPSDRLPDLIHAKLPGIALRSLPVPPRKIPFNAGFVYFQFQPRGPLWEHLLKYGGMALRVAGELPGLRMELWGVREK